MTARAAGTSLAGQCVGDGIVIDISKHFQKIGALDLANKTVTVEPGVIRDDLNRFLKPHGLFFGPNTSTSNRCTIGGMVGNNSCGSTSIVYGSTRDHTLELTTILSDGSEAVFNQQSFDKFKKKAQAQTLEGKIYRQIYDALSNEEVQQEIENNFPKKTVSRRNTGYAVDELLSYEGFGGENPTLNLATLLTGSEGTLAFTTEITLKLDELPPSKNCMVAAHFNSIKESMDAVLIAMKHNLNI